MKKFVKLVKEDKIIKWAVYASIAVLLAEILILLFSFSSLPPFLPLYNQLTWGESRLGTRIEIFLPVIISSSFLILNFLLLARLYEKMPLVSRILGITTLLLMVLSIIFILRTLYLIL